MFNLFIWILFPFKTNIFLKLYMSTIKLINIHVIKCAIKIKEPKNFNEAHWKITKNYWYLIFKNIQKFIQYKLIKHIQKIKYIFEVIQSSIFQRENPKSCTHIFRMTYPSKRQGERKFSWKKKTKLKLALLIYGSASRFTIPHKRRSFFPPF